MRPLSRFPNRTQPYVPAATFAELLTARFGAGKVFGPEPLKSGGFSPIRRIFADAESERSRFPYPFEGGNTAA
jgi:hypothetical protein